MCLTQLPGQKQFPPPEAGSSILRRAYLSRGGPIFLEAGLSVLRQAYLSRGGALSPENALGLLARQWAAFDVSLSLSLSLSL
jgi:hypothetical protein